MSASRPRGTDADASRYVPLFWRIFIPNATVLGVAGVVLAADPANGRVLVLLAGFVVMLTINLVTMRRSFAPLDRLTRIMRSVDPLRPGQRVPVLGPPSEVTVVAAAFNDMLDRVEGERRESARRELAAQQALRRHVARELHDELGQDLTALALQLDRMASGAVDDMRTCAAEGRDAALAAVEAVRVLARQLRPEVLDDLGLKPAVADLSSRLSHRTGLTIEHRIDPLPPSTDADTQLVIYRVIQESLTNVLRHAQASRAQITVRVDDEAILTTIQDDGVGMEVNGNLRQGGMLHMHERAVLAGGTVDVRSAAGAGTRVQLRIPRGPQ